VRVEDGEEGGLWLAFGVWGPLDLRVVHEADPEAAAGIDGSVVCSHSGGI